MDIINIDPSPDKSQEKTISCLIWSLIIFPAAVVVKFKEKVVNVGKKSKRIAEDDPRRIIHSAKVGLALTIVSLLYYFRPLYDGFGQSGMWAILTVVVVFEFTVGGTLSKCLNRGFATLIAGCLGIGADYLASICGEKGEPVVMAILVFFLAAVSTFIRFFPHIKQRYDYGVVIFILTFSLVTISGYRVEQILEVAHQRLSTIFIGAATCVIISVFFCPVWAGEDLHNLIASNIDKLAACLQGIGCENSLLGYQDENSMPQNYKSVLNTKAVEESLANFAWWEPGHGSFRFSHPWKQYLKTGVIIRECAYQLEALIATRISDPKAQKEIESKMGKSFTMISSEVGKALKELSWAVKEMRDPSSSAVQTHLQNSKSAVEELTRIVLQALTTSEKKEGIFMEIMQAVPMASILVEIINCVEKLRESVLGLSKQANFKGGCRNGMTTTTEENNRHHHHHKPSSCQLLGLGHFHGKKKNHQVQDEHIVINVLHGTSHNNTTAQRDT